MYLLEGNPLAPDRPFVTSDGTQYPANWLRFASSEEKQAIGITEVPDPRPYDQRFYWGYSSDGALIPKDLDQLKTQWVSKTKETANSMLSQSDWMVIREADSSSSKVLSDEIRDERSLIRQKSNEKETRINSCQTVDELAAYVTGIEYSSWHNAVSTEESGTDGGTEGGSTSSGIEGGSTTGTVVFS